MLKESIKDIVYVSLFIIGVGIFLFYSYREYCDYEEKINALCIKIVSARPDYHPELTLQEKVYLYRRQAEFNAKIKLYKVNRSYIEPYRHRTICPIISLH